MNWFDGQLSWLPFVAAKAALIYLAALIGLRFAHRRTLAQWTAIDFAAAVAVGAIIGRTALASRQSFLMGLVALVTLLVAHTIVTYARLHGGVARLIDHRVRVLVEHGRIRSSQLRLAGVTEAELMAKLREKGYGDLRSLRFVIYESKGELSVVREDGRPNAPMVREALASAAGYDVSEEERPTASS